MIKKLFNTIYNKSFHLLLKNNKPAILSVIFLSIISDIVFIKENSDLIIFGILGLYIGAILFYKLKSRLTFILALFLLGVMYIKFIFSGTSESTEKAAVWLFFFLLIGIAQAWKE